MRQIFKLFVRNASLCRRCFEIFDKCNELKNSGQDLYIFNQFEEFGNPIWHYNVTGPALEEVFSSLKQTSGSPAAFVSATGSAGTIAAGDYLKKLHPHLKIVASEALQCPTLWMNGFGAHRIEGIGDKHIPWVHNARNTDAVAAIDDEDCMRILRLFNEETGRKFLQSEGVTKDEAATLPLLGISAIGNLLAAVKVAKYYELSERDVVFTIFTDSVDLYRSRLDELNRKRGTYTDIQAAQDFAGPLQHQGIDYFKELTYYERKAIHNLKYFTWVEQQGRTSEELIEQWDPEYWRTMFEEEVGYFDKLIAEFNSEAA